MFFSRTGGVENIASFFNQFLKNAQTTQTYTTVGRELNVLLESNLLERTLVHLQVPAAGDQALYLSLLHGTERARQAKLFAMISRLQLSNGRWQPLAAGRLLGQLAAEQTPNRRLPTITGLLTEMPKQFEGLKWDTEKQIAVPNPGLDLFLFADLAAGAFSHLKLDQDIGVGVVETFNLLQHLSNAEEWSKQRVEVAAALSTGVPLARGRRDKHLMELLCHQFQDKITLPEVRVHC